MLLVPAGEAKVSAIPALAVGETNTPRQSKTVSSAQLAVHQMTPD